MVTKLFLRGKEVFKVVHASLQKGALMGTHFSPYKKIIVSVDE
ncbi:hypothetical protein RV02_GL001381 [Enterococcus gilvus]|nr:hypothetical protein RV02_GL001381 [Enterococcus gilvus]